MPVGATGVSLVLERIKGSDGAGQRVRTGDVQRFKVRLNGMGEGARVAVAASPAEALAEVVCAPSPDHPAWSPGPRAVMPEHARLPGADREELAEGSRAEVATAGEAASEELAVRALSVPSGSTRTGASLPGTRVCRLGEVSGERSVEVTLTAPAGARAVALAAAAWVRTDAGDGLTAMADTVSTGVRSTVPATRPPGPDEPGGGARVPYGVRDRSQDADYSAVAGAGRPPAGPGVGEWPGPEFWPPAGPVAGGGWPPGSGGDGPRPVGPDDGPPPGYGAEARSPGGAEGRRPAGVERHSPVWRGAGEPGVRERGVEAREPVEAGAQEHGQVIRELEGARREAQGPPAMRGGVEEQGPPAVSPQRAPGTSAQEQGADPGPAQQPPIGTRSQGSPSHGSRSHGGAQSRGSGQPQGAVPQGVGQPQGAGQPQGTAQPGAAQPQKTAQAQGRQSLPAQNRGAAQAQGSTRSHGSTQSLPYANAQEVPDGFAQAFPDGAPQVPATAGNVPSPEVSFPPAASPGSAPLPFEMVSSAKRVRPEEGVSIVDGATGFWLAAAAVGLLLGALGLIVTVQQGRNRKLEL
ncbi:hypothetical protein [Nonomuraea sp. B1E8]|uniref:hypothetical protein n=1 Tax=unclassified Nonomuraea TaxID=2593643 RepID=UPI00325C9109